MKWRWKKWEKSEMKWIKWRWKNRKTIGKGWKGGKRWMEKI